MIHASILQQFELYLAKFGADEPAHDRLADFLTRNHSITDRSNMLGHVTASALVIERAAVLLIKHNGLNRWLQPGGHIESGENPETAALRETHEETSVRTELAHWHLDHRCPIDINAHQIPANPKKNEIEHWHFDFRYVFRPSSQAGQLKLDEVSAMRWVPLSEVRATAPTIWPAIERAGRLHLLSAPISELSS